MKKIITAILFLLITLTVSGLEEAKENAADSGEVKVKIVEEVLVPPTVEKENTASPDVEIEVVEKIDSSLLGVNVEKVVSTPTASTVNAPVAVAEITPANPDKNLVIYFILLMVIVVGIMVLASVIPAPRSRNSQ